MSISDDALQIAQVVEKWHAKRMADLKTLTDADDVKELRLATDGETDIVLTGREAEMFRAGVETGMRMFAKLPFTLTQTDEEDDEEDDDE